MPILTPQQIAQIQARREANAAASRAAYAKAPRVANVDALNPIGLDDLVVAGREAAAESTFAPMQFIDAPVPPQGTRNVIPMGMGYKKNTGLGAENLDALNASAQGIRTTTTRDNALDKGVINRLDAGDRVVFYNQKTGEALLANALGKQGLDPAVWQNGGTNPQATGARRDWAQGEGGNPKYANLNLFGAYSPTVLELDQTFSKPKYNNQTLGADSVVLSYAPQGQVVPISSLPPRTQQAIAQRNDYSQQSNEYTTGEGQFFRDTAFEWGMNPIRKRMDYGLKGNPLQPDNILVAQDMIPVDGGVKRFAWENRGKNVGAIPVIWDKSKGDNIPLMDAYPPGSGLDYANFLSSRNTPRYYTNKDFNSLKGITDLSSYNVEKIQREGRLPFYKVQSKYIPEGTTGVRQRDMEGLNSTLYDINRRQQEAVNTRANTFTEVYRGSSGESGLEAIDEVARAGGSGRWSDDPEQDLLNLWNANVQSKADSMTADDLARGGARGSGKLIPISGSNNYAWAGSGTSSLPRLTEEDFVAGRVAYNSRGIPVNTDAGVVRKQGPQTEFSHPGYLYVTNSTPVREGINNFTPASEFTRSVPQRLAYPETANRTVQRIATQPETPLSLARVNEYGVTDYDVNPANPYIFPDDYTGRRVANLSVQRANNALDTSQMSSRGRWMGGGLNVPPNSSKEKRKDRSQSQLDPLVEERKIAVPVEGKYVRLLPTDDPRRQQALQQQIVAHRESENVPEDPDPFTRQYEITRTGKLIKPETPKSVIEGAFLPLTTEIPRKVGDAEFYKDWLPYRPVDKLLHQHLADVRIKLDDNYYPLTPEATATPYLLSETDLAKVNDELFSRQHIDKDDNVTYFNAADPNDAYRELQAKINQRNAKRSGKNFEAFDADEPSEEYLVQASKNPRQFNPENDVDGYANFDDSNDVEVHVDYDAEGNAQRTIAYRKGKDRIRTETYLDPSLSPTDIVQGISDKTKELNRINASINNRLTSPSANAPDAMSIVMPDGTTQRIPFVDSFLKRSNTGRRYISQRGQLTEGEMPVSLSVNEPLNSNYSPVTANRFMDEKEAARVAAQLETRPKKYKEIWESDGTSYLEEVDDVSVNDLRDIFNVDPDRRLTVEELQARNNALEQDIAKATNAYKQLMALEAAPEIKISATPSTKRQTRTLGEQMEQMGLDLEEGQAKNQLIGYGSLPVDLPATKQLSLPVQYPDRTEYDPELIAMAEQGQQDTAAAQKLIDLATGYRQGQRMEKIGYPSIPRDLGEEGAAAVQERIVKQAGRDARLERLADTQAQQFADLLTNPPALTPEVVPVTAQDLLNQSLQVEYPSSPIEEGERTFFAIDNGIPDSKRRFYKPDQRSIDASKEIDRVIDRRRIVLPRNKGVIAAPSSPLEKTMTPQTYDYLMSQATQLSPQEQAQVLSTVKQQLTPQEYDRLVAQINNSSSSPVVAAPTQEPTYVTINDLTTPQGLVELPPRVPVQETPQPQSVNVRQPSTYSQPVLENYEPYAPPQYTTVEDLQNPGRRLPGWAIPAGVGASLLGVAGISRYQKEQERRRQEEEMMLRRMYGG